MSDREDACTWTLAFFLVHVVVPVGFADPAEKEETNPPLPLALPPSLLYHLLLLVIGSEQGVGVSFLDRSRIDCWTRDRYTAVFVPAPTFS